MGDARDNLKTLRVFAERTGERIDTNRYMKALRSRLDYLNKKISARQASEGAISYLKEERDAMMWAIEELDNVRIEKYGATKRFAPCTPSEPANS